MFKVEYFIYLGSHWKLDKHTRNILFKAFYSYFGSAFIQQQAYLFCKSLRYVIIIIIITTTTIVNII